MKIFILAALVFCSLPTLAYKDQSYYVGLGYYSQNAFYRISSKDDSSTNLLGTAQYPLALRYDWNFMQDWFLSPQFTYSILSRKASGDTASITTWHLLLPVGRSFNQSGDHSFDWSTGFGFMSYTFKGAGGYKTLNNGTSSSSFAVPAGTSTVHTITYNLGFAYNIDTSRVGLDLIVEGLLSSKRTESFMLSYTYRFGGGR